VITEIAWLVRAYPEALNALLTSFASGPFHLGALDQGDLPGIRAILGRYRHLNIQLADAALLHLANREGIETVFTLDRRDFGVLRLARNRKLRIIP
jgi:predicted nucleic acid-binding protein